MAQDLIIVSSFPEKKVAHGAKTVGVASYTKLLAESLAGKWPGQITIYAEILDQAETYQENGLWIRRLWQRNGLFSLLKLLLRLILSPIKKILISFEIHMFGGLLANLLMMMGLLLLALTGKRVTLILHQAPRQLNDLEQHWLLTPIKNGLLKFWYVYLNLVTRQILVFEEHLRRGLRSKAIFIPHFVDQVTKTLTQVEARKKLGLAVNKKYAMVFGYLAPYKGVKWLVENWSSDFAYELLVVGGINPNHANNPMIQAYVREVKKLAQQKNIAVTGFVNEHDLALYFTACDVVILPYLTMFSSSGPLSLAFSYQKPVLMSVQLAPYFDSADLAQALSKANLELNDLVFALDQEALRLVLAKLDQQQINKMKAFARLMQEARSLSAVTQQYLDLLNQK